VTALKQPSLVSVSDYLDGEEVTDVKHEYLGGEVHAMAGATNRHNTISLNAGVSLSNQLRGRTCQPFNSDTKIRIEQSDHVRFYYPDAMVVCHPNPDSDRFQDHPVVVVEVISESTRRTDLGEKRAAYLGIPSLKVLIFAESEEARAVVHRRRVDGGFAVEQHDGLEAAIPLPEIEAELRLADLYERVSFT
jgi:Uma2 family endonuclease